MRTLAPSTDAQIAMGGRVNSRWLQARDLNLHLNFQERMITADSLLRYQSSLVNRIRNLGEGGRVLVSKRTSLSPSARSPFDPKRNGASPSEPKSEQPVRLGAGLSVYGEKIVIATGGMLCPS